MSLDERELEEALRSATETLDEPELDFATLMALGQGRLDGEAAESARRALVANPDLAQALLDVDRPEELEAAAGVDAEQQSAAWQRFLAATAAESTGEPEISRPQTAQTLQTAALATGEPNLRPWPSRFRSFVARNPLISLAASMVLASGLTIALVEPKAPAMSGNLESESLSLGASAGPKRSSTGQTSTLHVSRQISSVVLTLNPPSRLDLGFDLPAVAEATLTQGDDALPQTSVKLQEEGHYMLMVSVGHLQPGQATVELRDPESGSIFAAYSFDVRFQD